MAAPSFISRPLFDLSFSGSVIYVDSNKPMCSLGSVVLKTLYEDDRKELYMFLRTKLSPAVCEMVEEGCSLTLKVVRPVGIKEHSMELLTASLFERIRLWQTSHHNNFSIVGLGSTEFSCPTSISPEVGLEIAAKGVTGAKLSLETLELQLKSHKDGKIPFEFNGETHLLSGAVLLGCAKRQLTYAKNAAYQSIDILKRSSGSSRLISWKEISFPVDVADITPRAFGPAASLSS